MTFFTRTIGEKDSPVILWGHGWGQSHEAFQPLAESLSRQGKHILIDFPGFGKSSQPDADWSTEDYADALALWIREQNLPPVLWVGHSFGGRVGIQLAARHPELVKGLFLIAGAGLKRQRPPLKKAYFWLRVRLFKLLKKLIPLGLNEEWLRGKFGSRDYNNAGPLRGIFLKTIAEDLSPVATAIKCPLTLVYGEKDTETPPEFGQRYHALVPGSSLFILEGEDHYSVLSHGRHQVAALLSEFITRHAA
ncbi:MAG: alpha/beta hydrolase [Alphaproteobacteria bacterium]|nr:alpha/beta hydrolase [Alphaproteobacteria bacterium]